MVKNRQERSDHISKRLVRSKRTPAKCPRTRTRTNQSEPVGASPEAKPKPKVHYELPEYTQWFDIDSINYIEEECASNIFIGYGQDKEALYDVYKKVRNKIVDIYRSDPSKFLSITECIRRIGMDASIVMKVHSLLNYWGIINYQATNEFGERLFNKRINDEICELRGNQSNVFNSGNKLNFNEILNKATRPGSTQTTNDYINYCNSNYQCDSAKYSQETSSTRRDYNMSTIEDVVRYSSELNSGQVGSNVNHPRCCGCDHPCKSSYYILGPDSLGEVNASVRNRGIWCSLCYCNSNYPLSLSKDSFVRIDIPPRLSETISRLFDSTNFNTTRNSNKTAVHTTATNTTNTEHTHHFNGSHNNTTEPSDTQSSQGGPQTTNSSNNLTETRFSNTSNVDSMNSDQTVGRSRQTDKSPLPWSPSDFERLYEAIRKYGTDWQSVAQHLGDDTTPNECIFQFINAPLEREVTSKLKLTTYMDPPINDSINPSFPFFDSPNTIVTLLSFCSSVVSPVVASYAAKAAFNIILKSAHPDPISKGRIAEPKVQNTGKDQGEARDADAQATHQDTSFFSPSTTSKSNQEEDHNDGGTGSEGTNEQNRTDRKDQETVLKKYVDGSTLQLAAAAALGAAAERAGELAMKEHDRLSQALPKLISLKVQRITEKLNRYNQTQDRMKSEQLQLEKELIRILKCKSLFQGNA